MMFILAHSTYSSSGFFPNELVKQVSVRWLTYRNVDASKKNFVATGILVFDFELFIRGRVQKDEGRTTLSSCKPLK